ncbi:MAG: hypothetical protein JJT90_12700 [Ectothiorhodospiraceae bacterium]|nr:hypothetical protein [Ectothiorhodospiraceae bacterium]
MQQIQGEGLRRTSSGRRYFYIGQEGGLARGWYMRTREGLRGPFDTRADAVAMLRILVSAHPRKRVSNWHLS